VVRIVDLFCGIGGVAEASRDLADAVCTASRLDALPTVLPEVVAAIDIDRRIVPIYSNNHRVEPLIRTIESIRRIPNADLWWLSPPCQPYTQRGKSKGAEDPRSQGLARVIELVDREQPRGVILENIPEFAGSVHHRSLEATLIKSGYSVRADELCPTQWNVPMRRRRFYLRARRDGGAIAPIAFESLGRPLAECLDEFAWEDSTLMVSENDRTKYESAMNVVVADDPLAVAACFTSAYGNSPVHAGSYLRCSQRGLLRRFSPQEIARLMGYREGFWWPEELDLRARYHFLGNALSVTVVRALLASMIQIC
jgi:site-specific DNA-cytosine methylase